MTAQCDQPKPSDVQPPPTEPTLQDAYLAFIEFTELQHKYNLLLSEADRIHNLARSQKCLDTIGDYLLTKWVQELL